RSVLRRDRRGAFAPARNHPFAHPPASPQATRAPESARRPGGESLMSAELNALRNFWQTTPEPNEQTRADARARLFVEIDANAKGFPRREQIRPWRGMLPRRRLGLLFAGMVVVLLLIVAVAFTFGVPVLDFGQAEKAPPESRVVKNFAVLDQGAPPGMATDVI